MAKYIDGKRVSKKWWVVLRAAARDGIAFLLTSGRRTMAEQWALWRLWKAGKGNLAAFPDPNAPHIRLGRSNHALDINSLDGGESRFEHWIENNTRGGIDWSNSVLGESWHGEVSVEDLNRLYRYFKPLLVLNSKEWRWVREYDQLKRKNLNADRRLVLQRVMEQQRRAVWRLARAEKNRAKRKRLWRRYNILAARTD